MSRTRIPASLRRQVLRRASGLCEYCLIHERDTYFGCEVDHIISEKHGGRTSAENLAYACLPCNRAKGSDIATLDPSGGRLVRLFNPRTDCWGDHFTLDQQVRMIALSDIGAATISLLSFNATERLLERQSLHEQGRYPSPEAQKFLTDE